MLASHGGDTDIGWRKNVVETFKEALLLKSTHYIVLNIGDEVRFKLLHLYNVTPAKSGGVTCDHEGVEVD